jgi:hypothetical protein
VIGLMSGFAESLHQISSSLDIVFYNQQAHAALHQVCYRKAGRNSGLLYLSGNSLDQSSVCRSASIPIIEAKGYEPGR